VGLVGNRQHPTEQRFLVRRPRTSFLPPNQNILKIVYTIVYNFIYLYTLIYTLWINLWKTVQIRGQIAFVYNIVYKKCVQVKINLAKLSKFFLNNKNIRLTLDKTIKIWYSMYVGHYNAVVLPTSSLSGRPPSLLLYFCQVTLISVSSFG